MSSNFFMRDKNDELLFWKYDLSLVIQKHEQSLVDEVNSFEKDYVMNTDIDVICSKLKRKYEIKPIILRRDKIYISDPVETKVDISQDRDRAILDRSRPHYVQGMAVTYAVPYEGDELLLYCKGSAYTMNPPMARVTNNDVQFKYYGVSPDPEKIKADFEKRLRDLEEHIKYVVNDIIPYNNGLLDKIEQMVRERINRISKSEEIVSALGYPQKSSTGASEIKLAEDSKSPKITKKPVESKIRTSKWDFFICHASEDKEDAVIPICNVLLKKGYRVWLDRFVLKLGDSLREKIDEGLKGSKYGIVILSPNFFAKKWPKDELDGLVALEQDGRKRILPIWHNVDYEDVRRYSPILAGRLGVKTSEGIEVVVNKIIEASND